MPVALRILVALMFPAVAGAVIFASAGRADLPWVWAFLCVHAAFMTAYMLVVPRELMAERLKPPEEGRVHDRHRRLVLPLVAASWVLTGLDLGRLHWTDGVPRGLRLAGFVVFAAGMILTLWAVAANRFYSSVIRIQRDRGQEPVTTGPYRAVRHPGYTGTLLAVLGSGLALGSWLGMAPLLGVVLLFVRRTLTEDRMLRDELDGYAEYAARVRRRLIPGVW